MNRFRWFVMAALAVGALSACSPQGSDLGDAEVVVSEQTTIQVLDEFISLHPNHLILNKSSSTKEISLLKDLIGVVCLSIDSGISKNLIRQSLRSSGAFTATELNDLISLSIKHQCTTFG